MKGQIVGIEDWRLFLHDAGHSAEPFRTLLGAAADQGRRAIALDLPGFAGSTGRVRSFAPRAIAAHVARFIEALRLPRVDLVGVGWGGLVARSLAGDQPALVRALLTIDTPYERLDARFRRRRDEARGDPDVLRRRLLRELPPGLPEDLRSALGIAIAETSARALTSAYRRLRVVTRKLDNGASELILAGLPRPGQPWLAVRSEGGPEREPADAPRSESWSQPLADPARVWAALAELAASATR